MIDMLQELESVLVVSADPARAERVAEALRPAGGPVTLQEHGRDAGAALDAGVGRRQIAAMLRYTNANRRKAAQMLGLARSTLLAKIRRYGLEPAPAHTEV